MKDIGLATLERRQAYEHIAMSLTMRYDIIYCVDVSSGAYFVFSSTDAYKELGIFSDGNDYFAEIRQRLNEVVHPDDRHTVVILTFRDAMLDALNRERVIGVTFRMRCQDRYIYMAGQAMWADDSRHLIVGFKDIDAWEHRRREADQRAQIYSDIAQTLARRYECIYYLDLQDLSCTRFSTQFDGESECLTGNGESFFDLARQQIEKIIHPADRKRMAPLTDRGALLSAIDREGVLSITVRGLRNGRYSYIHFRGMWAKDRRHVILTVSDVDAKVRRKKAQERAMREAEHRAMRDELTRVRNKNAYAELEDELQHAIDDGHPEPMAIVMCDVNDLKSVNDHRGHLAGDALLQDACKLICTTYSHSPVFRVGGDEFVVVLRGGDYANRHALLEQLRGEAREQLQCGGTVVAAGMSDFQDDHCISDVFERADREMYEDKRALKSRA